MKNGIEMTSKTCFQNFLVLIFKRVDFLVKNNKTEFDSAINKIAMYISDMIKNRNLILKPIRYFDKMDEMSGKMNCPMMLTIP